MIFLHIRYFSSCLLHKNELSSVLLNHLNSDGMRSILSVLLLVTGLACSQPTDKQTEACQHKRGIKVVLKPMEYTDTVMLKKLCLVIDTFYHAETSVIENSPLPGFAYYKGRNRYRADKLLDYLAGIIPEHSDYIIGLTDKDISTTNGKYDDWGIFGLGFMPGKSCVISTFRLKGHIKSPMHYEERLIKVVLHELGHNFGLDHCITKNCMMEDAGGTIKTIDNEKTGLCPVCRGKLKKLLPQ